MPLARTRIALGLLALAALALELALMRTLALRFWQHFACMVISVALLGFGASGTFLALLRHRIAGRERAWLCALAFAFALSIPAAALASRHIPLDVQFLAWNLSQLGNVLLLELLMLTPFFLAASALGVALLDRPERLSGHYAANLVGSGLGAVAAVAAMQVLSTERLPLAASGVAWLAGLLLLSRRGLALVLAGAATAALAVLAWMAPQEPDISPYKMLAVAKEMPDTEVLHQAEGPLGRVDVVANPALHHAPGLSLQYAGVIPPHVLLLTDGDQASAVYDCRRREDWAFLDHTTTALPYHLRKQPSVLVMGAGGGADIGLALFHQSGSVTALEMNRQVIETMTGPLRARGGGIYQAPSVTIVNEEGRSYLAGAEGRFDIIQLPALDPFGASGAGLYAAQESYLYTVESFAAMLERLSERGVLCITRWARTPPRDGLRAFDTVAEALRRKGWEPAPRLAMIRSWATETILASREPLTDQDVAAVRAFCKERGFDLCCLPGLQETETNSYHVLDRPYYFESTRALLGPQREAYLADYLFKIAAPTDDKPYFFHLLRWRSLALIKEQVGGRSRAFVELGSVMLVGALVQAAVLAVVLILLPLAPGIGALKPEKGKAATLGYFLFVGAGFMLLEMGFVQKLILYLGHPVYSAAVAIAGFLIFAGLGSELSQHWRRTPKGIMVAVAAAIVLLALAYLLLLDSWLAFARVGSTAARFLVAALTIAPLGLALGHMFPAGLRQVAPAAPALVPWAWGVNGLASVAATAAAPVVAMNLGFSRLALIAAACYAAAGLLSRWLPGGPMRS